MPNNVFYFRLQKDNLEKRYKQCTAMHIMSALVLIFYGLHYLSSDNGEWMYVFAIVPASIMIIFLALFRKNMFHDANTNRTFRILEIGLLMLGAMHFFQLQSWWAAILFSIVCAVVMLLAWMENRIFQAQFIDITDQNISVATSLYDKHFNWKDIQNIILKHDFITFHFNDDRFQQYRIFEEYSLQDQAEFEMLMNAKKK